MVFATITFVWFGLEDKFRCLRFRISRGGKLVMDGWGRLAGWLARSVTWNGWMDE
jgi:hypothetical protein